MIAALVMLALAAEPLDPERVVDFEAAAVLSHPERFAVCVGLHPSRVFEVDLCPAIDRGLIALSGHVFARKRWSRSAVTVAFGAGLGVRAASFCPFRTCALQAGPEALLSLEAVWWLQPGFGLTAQLDAGLAVVWALSAPGLYEHSYRVPARLLLGVAL